jgi:hypothetical protein
METSGTANNLGFTHVFNQNAGTVFFNFAHAQNSVLSAGNTTNFRFYDNATVQFSMNINGNGNFEFYRGDRSVLLGTYAGAFPGGNVWNHFQVKIIFNNGAGEVHVRKNGSATDNFVLTGINTISTVNAYANKLDSITVNSANPVQKFDDMWIFSATVVAGEPSDFLGDMRAIQIMPNSDNVVQFTPQTGPTNYTNVDELINASGDYVSSQTAGQVDLYGNPGFTVAPTSVLGLAIRSLGRKTDAGPRTVGHEIKSGATTVDSPGQAIGTLTEAVVMNADLDPNTGVAWTPSGVAALLFGPRVVT